jgi:protein-tyrosine phosphatase
MSWSEGACAWTSQPMPLGDACQNVLRKFTKLFLMRILFVCTANICRSVMAEALLEHLLSGPSNSIEVDSAGIDALVGQSPDRFTQQVSATHGLDVSSHQACQLTLEMLDRSHLVLCLAENHRQSILTAFPKFKTKVFLLKQFRREDPVQNPSVDDPIGQSLKHYERCYVEIEEEVRRIASRLIQDET